MARYVGHFGCDRLFAELSVEAAGKFQNSREHFPVHGFGLHRVGYAVPNDVTPADGFFQPAGRIGCRLTQIGIDQPRTGRPYIAFGRTLTAQLFGDGDRLRDEFVDVALFHLRTQFRKTDVEMCLEDRMNFFYPGIGLLSGAGQTQSQHEQQYDSSHGESVLSENYRSVPSSRAMA